MTEKTLVVLAAGMGSRYGGLKQIDPVGPNGELVIDYSAFDAKRAGFNRIVFVIRKEMLNDFRDGIGKAMETRMDTAYAFQSIDDLPGSFTVPPGREKPWGTAHAVYAARDEIETPFAVINADDFYGQRAYELLARHLDGAPASSAVPSYAMIGYELGRTISEHGTVARGICRMNDKGNLQSIEEVTTIEKAGSEIFSTREDGTRETYGPDTLTSMNCWGFTLDLLDELDIHFTRFLKKSGNEMKSEFYLPKTIGTLIAEGGAKVNVLRTSDNWFGVTYREDKPFVMAGIQKLIDEGIYPASLWE